MGQGQSSGSGASQGAAAAAVDVKTSYYELLGLDRQATDDEIKKAYRRKALELHPDRNFGDVERTTKLFAEVQAAYEVLSDPQERAWYDSHESAILRGADPSSGADEAHYEHNTRVTTSDDIYRMIRKFNSGVDFSDSPTGFFGFLREAFETLAQEETLAATWGESASEPVDYPSFGHRDDDYDDVVRSFYAVWAGFSTRKSFSWKDKWRYSEAPDRRVRRLMEKENKQLREEAMREFNDAVRSLVAFVRKRDPRYKPNSQTEAERTQALRDASARQAARARAANEAKLTEEVPDWAKARDPEEDDVSEDEEIEEEHFECVACHKTFKSERQFDAHEKSKKHQKAVQALRRMMQKENKNLNLDEAVSRAAAAAPDSVEDSDVGEVPLDEHPADEDNVLSLSESEEDSQTSKQKKKKQKKKKKQMTSISTSEDEETDVPEKDEQEKKGNSVTENVEDDEDEDEDEDNDDDDDEDDEYASREAVERRLAGMSVSETPSSAQDEETTPATAASSSKVGKAAQKRAKKAAQQAAQSEEELKFKCAVCNAAFPSKTRMFQHIKDFGHAAPVQQKGGGKAGGGAKGKGKR